MTIKSVRDFLELESIAGLLLMLAAIFALFCNNSFLSTWYQGFLEIPVAVSLGSAQIAKPLLLWVNDGLMALFFLMVGLEIKLEFSEGKLTSPSQWALPLLAAAGGMVVPTLVFIYFNAAYEGALEGWAIPTATDIAFALGLLSMFGSRVPMGLKVFLMTFAILDDLAAIVIIAVFYTDNLSLLSMTLAIICVALLVIFNFFRVRRISAYSLVGIILWVCVLKSGVHATLAGVIVAFALPFSQPTIGKNGIPIEKQTTREFIHSLHPWVAFLIVPLFAFMNSGISFQGITLDSFLTPVCLGVMLGLFLGKQLGLFGFSWIAIKMGLTHLPYGVRWRDLYAACVLGGVGFTMSLFISTLAYEGLASQFILDARLGILSGSVLSLIFGCLFLYLFLPKKKEINHAT